VKVLVSAYACAPDAGSEPGVGWNWVEQIARFHDVWVLTRRNNRAAIEQSLKRRPQPNVHWVYVDLPAWARFWKRGQRGVHAYYYLWQVAAYLRGRRLNREVEFDVVQHVTFVNYWMPSLLALLPAPFVWGPVGGGESAPPAFSRTLSARGRGYEYVRALARSIGERDVFVRRTARRAAAVVATTAETATRLSHLGARNVHIVSQVALTAKDLARLGRIPVRTVGPFRAISIGRLVDWKGFHLGLRAFAALHEHVPASEYWIVGDGPDRRHVEKTVMALGLETAVVFKEWMPRDELLTQLAQCDVLVHPSLHDSGGWVCAEAMAAGRPVICLALGGPAVQVTARTGFAVPADTPGTAVQRIAAALIRLATDPSLRLQMAEAARQRALTAFRWEERGDFIQSIYTQVTTGPSARHRSAGYLGRSRLTSWLRRPSRRVGSSSRPYPSAENGS